MQVVEQLKNTSEDRFLKIYEALATGGFGPLDNEVAQVLKFRPQAIRKLPMAQRARRARSWLLGKANAELTYELFGTYLLKEHKDLVTGFLDATGVEHEDGMLEELDENEPKRDKLEGAVSELDGKFDPDNVTLYLSMCAQQWPEIPELEGIWKKRVGA